VRARSLAVDQHVVALADADQQVVDRDRAQGLSVAGDHRQRVVVDLEAQ
jgi:hypothetical protein